MARFGLYLAGALMNGVGIFYPPYWTAPINVAGLVASLMCVRWAFIDARALPTPTAESERE